MTTTTKSGKKGVDATRSSQQSIGEDNGFQNTLQVPLGSHFTVAGIYDRSLRNKVDVAGFSVTWLLRAPPAAQTDTDATR